MADANRTDAAHGVEALIERLRADGVAQGRAEAERIVGEAERRARWIVRQAEEEAQQLRERARQEADSLQAAGQEALHVAARDTVLTLKNQLLQRFSGDVERLVGTQLQDEGFLQRLILELAGRVRREAELDTAGTATVLLPAQAVALDELRRRPEELREGTLSHFVLTLAAEMLREGVTFSADADLHAGIRVQLGERGVEIDLSERAVAALLLTHLQPRFRAFLEGIVRG